MNFTDASVILRDVKYPGYQFVLYQGEHGELSLRAWYKEPDITTGRVETQWTRYWPIDASWNKGQLVQTAFKCVLTSHEHRAREHFTYQGERVFGPHLALDGLVALARDARIAEERMAA